MNGHNDKSLTRRSRGVGRTTAMERGMTPRPQGRESGERFEEAERLADAGRWEQAFALLAASGESVQAARLLEQLTFRLLARGDILVVRAAIAEIPPARRSLLLRVAEADALVRSQSGFLADLERLRDETEAAHAAGGPDYRWWLAAIVAEHFLTQGDGLALELAETALELAPHDPLPPTPVLMGRGRLRRIAGIALLWSAGGAAQQEARARVEAAELDLARAGWEEERAMTAVLFWASLAAVTMDDCDVAQRSVTDAVATLRELRSPYLLVALCALGNVALLGGDLWTMHRVLAEADSLGATVIPGAVQVVRYLRALADLFGEGPSPAVMEELEDVGSGFGSVLVEGAGAITAVVAGCLLDFGAVDDARRWVGRGPHGQLFNPQWDVTADVLAARLRLAGDGDPGGVPELEAAVERLVGLGLGRRGGLEALRGARDCERVGLDAEGAALRALGRRLVPPPERMTLWEALAARPLGPAPAASAAPASGTAGGEVLLLRAAVEVRRAGEVCRLPTGAARLLAYLAVEHRPVTVDRIVELLWPDVDPRAGRTRLNTLVYRLRRALDLGPDELVVRTADGLAPEPGEGWRIDAWDFARLSRGGDAERLVALDMYGSDLCGRQLAYDDVVEDERARLRARWVDLAVEALDTGRREPGPLAETAAGLGIDDPDLTASLANAFAARGDHREAGRLRNS